jgi:O-antigen polymerase
MKLKIANQPIDLVFTICLLFLFSTILLTTTQLHDGSISIKTFSFLGVMSLISIHFTFVVFKSKMLVVNLVDLFLVGFVGLIGLSIALNPEASFLVHSLIEWVGLLFLYFYLKHFFKSDKSNVYVVLFMVLLVGIVELIWSNLQLYNIVKSNHPLFKVTGSFFNPGPFANFLALIFPLALSVFLFLEKGEDKIKALVKHSSIIYLVLFLLIIPATHARAAWISIICSGVLIFSIRYSVKEKAKALFNSKAKQIGIGVAAALVIAIAAVGLYAYKKDSADGRLLIWKISLNIIKDNPILGSGHNTFPLEYNKAQANYFMEGNATFQEKSIADYVYYAFNEFIQIWVELGLLGFLLFSGLLFLAIVPGWSKSDWLNRAFRISAFAFVITALFSYPLFILPVRILLIVALAYVSIKTGSNEKPIVRLPNYLSLIFLLPVIGLFAMVPLKQVKAYQDWGLAYRYQMTGGFSLADAKYKKAYDVLSYNGDFLQTYGKLLSLMEEYEKSNELLEKARKFNTDPFIYLTLGYNNYKLGKIEEAEKYFLFADQISPLKFYPKFSLAQIYFEHKETEKFKKVANQILKQKIKVNSPSIKQMKMQINDWLGQLEDPGIYSWSPVQKSF